MIKGIKQGIGIFLGIGISAVFAYTVSGTVKTWTTGETLTATDLNTTVQSLKTAIESATQIGRISNSISSETRYFGFIGDSSTTESDVQYTMPRAGTVKGLVTRVLTNTCTGATSIVLRNNGVDTSLSFSVPASTTTALVAQTGNYSFVAGDKLTWKVSCATGTFGISMVYEY